MLRPLLRFLLRIKGFIRIFRLYAQLQLTDRLCNFTKEGSLNSRVARRLQAVVLRFYCWKPNKKSFFLDVCKLRSPLASTF